MQNQNLGDLIDEIFELREQKRRKEEEATEIQEKIAALESKIMALLDDQGLSKATGSKATVFVSELIRPHVEDWNRFYDYIHANRWFHLLERRPSVAGCAELFELQGQIPGVVPKVIRRLNIRKV
jgi:hypothetical protein